MRRLLALLAAALSSACSAASTRAEVTPGPDSPDQPAPHTHAEGAAEGGHHHGGMTHRFTDAATWARKFDDPARDEWQHPDDVLRAMALSPGMHVADVGAGTGYFAVRLARAVPQGEVIATDVEPDMVRYLDERAHREQLANLHAVEASQRASGLEPASADRVLIVHVWHHLDDRVAYARNIAASLRPGGKLLIVDFDRTSPRGPPPEYRLEPAAVVADLQAAGLTAKVSPVALPGQYIVEAWGGS